MSPGARLQDLTAKYMQNPRRFFVPLANEYRLAGELDRAIALCREHLPAQPGHMSGHIVLGRAYFEKGDAEAAREVFLTSVSLDDENVIALRHLGDIARLRNEIGEARQWYARVLDADPQNAEIERLLRSLHETGRPPSTGVVPSMVPAQPGAPETIRPPVPPGTQLPDPWARQTAMEPAIAERAPDPVPPEPWERRPTVAADTGPVDVVAPPSIVAPVPTDPVFTPPSAPTRWERLADALPAELPSEPVEEWERPRRVPQAPQPPLAMPQSEAPPAPVASGAQHPPFSGLEFVRPAPTTARPTPLHQMPPSTFDRSDAAAALSEPTPPGLRAILGEPPAAVPEPAAVGPIYDAEPVAPPLAPTIAPDELTLPAIALFGEGFGYDDLDELSVDALPDAMPGDGELVIGEAVVVELIEEVAEIPAPAAAQPELTELATAGADSDVTAVPTPSPVAEAMAAAPAPAVSPPAVNEAVDVGPAVALPELLEDDVAARPAFGALASFAAWRTARDRKTPVSTSAIVEVSDQAAPTAPPPLVVEREPDEVVAATSLPAAEFETETMAQLYAQQGFTEQALNVYRALARRTPADGALQARIEELEGRGAVSDADKSLEADADKALSFSDFADSGDIQSSTPSILEAMYDVSPPPRTDGLDGAEAAEAWRADAPADAGGDDWFAEEHGVLSDDQFRERSDAMFATPPSGFAAAATLPTPRESRAVASQSGSASLSTLFSGLEVVGADAAAGVLLIELASQMVGRLPKDAPTLPVPDVLELPTAPAADGGGVAKAPLLSFDRFFAGSGSPPRARIDTPPLPLRQTSSVPTLPTSAPVKAPPSLSPTFGGLPVIAPPPGATVPWASFEPTVTPPPAGAASRPAMPTAQTESPGRWATRSEPTSDAARHEGSDTSAVTGEPTPVVYVTSMPAPGAAVTDSPTRTDAPAQMPASDGQEGPDAGADTPRAAPSEFHRWLEGLS